MWPFETSSNFAIDNLLSHFKCYCTQVVLWGFFAFSSFERMCFMITDTARALHDDTSQS